MGKELIVAAILELAALLACGAPWPSPAEEISDPAGAASIESSASVNSNGATTWNAIRQRATELGVAVSMVYDGEGVVNAAGGQRTGSVYVGNLHLMLTVDAASLMGLQGATLFLNGLVTHGGHPSDLVGDAQGVSNLEAPPRAQLYEAWLQQSLLNNQVSTLVGLYDLNTEFYRLQSAALFLNSSFGVGPEFSQSGLGGPSIFPDTSVGIRIAFKPARGVVLRAAVLDGAPVHRPDGGERIFAEGDGLLLVGEAAFLTRPVPEDRPVSGRFRIGRNSGLPPYEGKIAVGGWYYTAEFEDLSEVGSNGQPIRHKGSGGLYLIGDESVYQSCGSSSRRIRAFGQLGLGDARVNRFGFYAGAGLVFSGLIPALDSDELGLAMAIARNGSHFLELQRQNDLAVTGTETALELTYLLQTGKHLAIQPDIQYVMRPGTDPTRRDALVFGLRFELSY
jgi:porin